jgi:hypothetical protein
VLTLIAPNEIQQAPWGVFHHLLVNKSGLEQVPLGIFDRLLANKPMVDCPSSHFFE